MGLLKLSSHFVPLAASVFIAIQLHNIKKQIFHFLLTASQQHRLSGRDEPHH